MDVSCSLHYRLPSRKTTWPVFSSGLCSARLIVCPLLTIAHCPFPLPNSIMSYCSCAPHKFVLPILFLTAQEASRRASSSACGPDVIQGYVSLFYLLRSSHIEEEEGQWKPSYHGKMGKCSTGTVLLPGASRSVNRSLATATGSITTNPGKRAGSVGEKEGCLVRAG